MLTNTSSIETASAVLATTAPRKSSDLMRRMRNSRAGFTLIEIMIAMGGVILLTTLILTGIKVYQKTVSARSVYAKMRQIDTTGKQMLKQKFMSGVDFPTGYTADTIDTYPVTLAEVAPYLQFAGHEEGAADIADADVVGPGRTLDCGTLGTASTCTPALDASLVGFGAK